MHGSGERVLRTPDVWRDRPRAAEEQGSSGKRLASVTLDTGLCVDLAPADNSWSPATVK